MPQSIFDQLKSRGEAFVGEVAGKLMANQAFLDALQQMVAAKEAVDGQVAQGLKKMNVATRKEVKAMESRIAALEAEIADLKAARRKPRSKV